MQMYIMLLNLVLCVSLDEAYDAVEHCISHPCIKQSGAYPSLQVIKKFMVLIRASEAFEVRKLMEYHVIGTTLV